MKIRNAFALCAALLPSFSVTALACMWDSDTLATEAKGLPDVVNTIVGRFERNPPLYYQMRLERTAAQLRASKPVFNASTLEKFDDAAVACDRLHRSTEAIAWMQQKRAVLRLASTRDKSVAREHWYRTYANEGTFYAHRWLRSGANRRNMSDMKRSRELLRAAIRLNPDAHFGREIYQLKAIEWIIAPPKYKASDGFGNLALYRGAEGQYAELPTFLWPEESFDDYDQDPKAAKAVEGLCGLVVLGDAWQSVDLFNTLAKAILRDDRRASLAYLSLLRADELATQKKFSMYPQAPRGARLKKLLRNQLEDAGLRPHQFRAAETAFKTLRADAEKWQAQRTAFMMQRLRAGRHPDTDATFWNGYTETPPLQVPPDSFLTKLTYKENLPKLFFAALFLTVTTPIALLIVFLKWRRRRRLAA